MVTDTIVAFAGEKRIARGTAAEAALAAKTHSETDPDAKILIFDGDGRQIDFDLSGSAEDVAERLREPARGPGRPKIGVVGREVTLLPRHWQWLQRQRGGASIALRRLVEEAMRSPWQEAQVARDSTYRFMSAMAGDRPGFEEAARALFAGADDKFLEIIECWPQDIAAHVAATAAAAFEGPG